MVVSKDTITLGASPRPFRLPWLPYVYRKILGKVSELANDAIFRGIAWVGACFIGWKALDKTPDSWGIGEARYEMLAPYFSFFGIPLGLGVTTLGLIQGAAALSLLHAVWTGSRKAFFLGVAIFLACLGVFLAGDAALAGSIPTKTIKHLDFVLGIAFLVSVVVFLDYIRSQGSKRVHG